MNGAAPRSEIRRCLTALFDDGSFTAFASDYFPDVSGRFSDGMSLDQKRTMLIAAMDHYKARGYGRLLEAVRKEVELDKKYGNETRIELVTLMNLTKGYLESEREACPTSVSNVEVWEQTRTSRSRFAATLFPSMQGDEVGVIDQLVTSESSAWTESQVFREATVDFLERMERFIELELRKSSDGQFVELSMKLARAPTEASPLLRQGLSLALMTDAGVSGQPDIENRAALHAALLERRQIVLLAPPGSGKTTVLHHYTLFLIGQYRLNASPLIPVFIPLTRYGIDLATGRVADIANFLRTQMGNLCGEEPHFLVERFHDVAKKGLFLFILDGLDQMPNRRSETARLERLRRIEKRLRGVDRLVKIASLFRRRDAVTMLLQSQRTISSELAPQPDPREEQIGALGGLWACATITSCRIQDFVGVPAWQRVEVLPMSKMQIEEFVTAYAPEALEVVCSQYESNANRSLVSNPFYLRMLTRAVEEQRRMYGSVPAGFYQVLGRRGLLLSDLIWRSVHRETKNEETANAVMDGMGELTHFMLERNVIGALPEDALRRLLGENFEETLNIAHKAAIVELRQGPPISMEFNHQLFMEVLLAYHLRRLSREEGGFEKSLELLALQGDRWAETIKLLFEMIADPELADQLLDKCASALENPRTWDIATRVLSDVGRSISSRVAALLEHPHELTRRGAANILGRISAIEHTERLVDLAQDPEWPVRRAAVEALVQLGRVDRLTAFEQDTNSFVIRLIYRARILNHPFPPALIFEILKESNQMHREQAARATREVFHQLVKTQTPEALLKILTTMIGDANDQVSITGYLTAADAPFFIRRRLKLELIKGALYANNRTVNVLARSALCDVLDSTDMDRLRLMVKNADLFSGQSQWQGSPAARAYWLISEAEERISPKGFFESLLAAEPNEAQMLMLRLSKRGDSVALGILTYLLGKPSTCFAAMKALVSMGDEGIGHLLAALHDPLGQVQLTAAHALRYCHLPRQYWRRVREILRQNRIHSYQVHPLGARDANAINMIAAEYIAPISFVLTGTSYYLVGKIFSLGVPWIYWTRYASMNCFSFPGGSSVWLDESSVREIERVAFGRGAAEPSAEFWLTRGRLLRAIGDFGAARQSLERVLDNEPKSARARFELALVHRAQNELGVARRTLEMGCECELAKGTDNQVLHRILCLEIERPDGWDEEHLDLLIQLKLWKEAFPLLVSLFRRSAAPSEMDLLLLSLPDKAHLWLYQCYLGMNKTAQALAAALKHNEHNPATAIPQVDLDNLRWLHRLDAIPAEVQGEFCILVDLDQPANAKAFLQRSEILPLNGTLSDDNIDRIHDLPPTTQQLLIAFLEQMDSAQATAVRGLLRATTTKEVWSG